VREIGKRLTCRPECRERRRVVQRRKLDPLAERSLDLVVDEDRLAESEAAVDDPMYDAGEIARRLVEGRDGVRGAVDVDDRQLQARRARVDDKNLAQPGQVQFRTSG
jgi:hypothetical protein